MQEEFVGVNLKIGGEDALERGLNDVARSIRQLVAEAARLADKLAGQVRTSAKKGEASFISAEEAKARAVRRAVADSNKFLVDHHRSEIKTLGDAVREHQKAEKEKTAATKREAAERSRAEKQAKREAEAVQRAAINSRREYGRNVVMGAGGGARDAFGTLSGAAAMGAGGALAYGLSAAKGQAALEAKASDIAIATRDSAGSLDAADMVRRAQAIASRNGTDPGQVLDAIMAAAEHGQGRVGAEQFLANLDTFSSLGLATGTNLADLAENSAAMTSMGVRDPAAQRRAMLKIAGASKEGNIGLREMGANLSAAAGATEGFTGSAEERIVKASALMQLARASGAKSSEDAGTAVRNFYNDVANKKGDLEALGVSTKDKKTGLRRDAFDQYLDAIDKAKGDPDKLQGILGMQSRAVGQGMLAAYRRGGRPEVEKELGRYTSAEMSTAEVESDAEKKRKDASVRFAVELEKLRAAVGSKMLPLLVEHMPKLSEAVEKVVKAVGDPGNVQKFSDGLAFGVRALETFVKHPVLTGAAFVGVKAVMGGLEALASTWLGKNLFAPVTTVNAGVVNVVGGAPGLGALPGGAGGAAGAAGAGRMAGALGTAALAGGSLLAAGALVGGLAYGVVKGDEYLASKSATYKKFSDYNFHQTTNVAARDKAGRLLGMNEGSRAAAAAALGLEAPGGRPPALGADLAVPGASVNETSGRIEIAPGSKVGLDQQAADAIGESVSQAMRRAEDRKASGLSLLDRAR